MSNLYHINPETGRVNICRATKQKCPYGGETGQENHFSTKEEAKHHNEKILSEIYSNTTSLRKTKNSKNRSNADSNAKTYKRKTIPTMNQEQAAKLTAEMYQEFADLQKQLTKDEQRALHFYSGNGAEKINNLLRETATEKEMSKISKQTGYEIAKEITPILDNLMKEHDRGENKEPKKLYRYIEIPENTNIDEYIQENFENTDEYTDKAFISTTEDPEHIAGFIHAYGQKKKYVLLEIETNKGISLQDKPEEMSGRLTSFEKERLLPRDMKFSIESINETTIKPNPTRETLTRQFTTFADPKIKPAQLRMITLKEKG